MKKLCFALILAFLSILLLTSAGVAGEKKNQKNSSSYLWGNRLEALCHITGTYDFGEGEVPIGHVIKVPESAYLSRIKHGDIANWVVVTLPDGKEACYEPIEVCHITGTYDFGEGEVPIGQITSIPETYYQNHIGHGDPETYKVVTLPDDGSEVCLALGADETQFSKGIALFGHKDSGVHFTQRLDPGGIMGRELTRFSYQKDYQSMTSFFIDGKQYLMAISDHDDDGHRWFIQQILPSGDFGPVTNSGTFRLYYKTLIALPKADGSVYIFGQDEDEKHAMVRQIKPGGYLGPRTWDDHWDRYYDAATAIPVNHGRTCFYLHNSHDDNPWHIACLTSDGTVYIRDTGDWEHGYQVSLSYRTDGPYLFGHRHRYDSADAHYHGPWYIKEITGDSKMGDQYDHGEWWNFYKSMTVFRHPFDTTYYLIGHNTDKYWFIQHVSHLGHMLEQTDSGKWDHYYDHLFPVDYDKETYGTINNWMGRLNSIIGDRKLSEIALPGSHDSGMNVDDTVDDISVCFGGDPCTTVTQYGDIGYQLENGVRYFDIRPMIDKDESGTKNWTTGHAVGKAGSTWGCRGESKKSIVENLNSFFGNPEHSKELVILKVSHCMTPPGAGYADCTSDQIKNVAETLADDLDEHVVKCNPDVDDCNINNMTLNQILERGNILLVVDGYTERNHGIFRFGCEKASHYCLYDVYSNTDDFDKMWYDQALKLVYDWVHEAPYDAFLLSWTLTLSVNDALNCGISGYKSILERAEEAQPRLFEYINIFVDNGDITKFHFPNILYVDAVKRTQTNAAIYLNKIYDSLPD